MQDLLKTNLRTLGLVIVALGSLFISGCEESAQDHSENTAKNRKDVRDNDKHLEHAKKLASVPASNGMSSMAQFRAERDRKLKQEVLKQQKLQIAKVSFTTDHPPEGVTVEGLPTAEPWGGTWSVGERAAIHFEKPLPAKFKLSITGRAYGPNADLPFTLMMGSHKESMTFRSFDSTRTVAVNLDEPVDTLTIMIPKPTSPKELGESADDRKLGIGLVQILILQPDRLPATPATPPTNH